MPITGVVGWVASSVEDEVESSDEEEGAGVCSGEVKCVAAEDLEAVALVNGWKVDQVE